MSKPSEMQARHAAALGQLAELGLALAADIQRRALKAEDDDTASKLADSFHKVGRSVRQTLALEAKLIRDAEAAAREAAAEAARTKPARVRERRDEVRRQIERLIWDEVEDDHEAEVAVDMLRDLTHPDAVDFDFADSPLDMIVSRLKTRVFAELEEYRQLPAEEREGDGDDGPFADLEGDFSPPPEIRNTG